MSERADVLVIGAGVIGMATAAELASRGAQVTVIDRGEPGYGCSYGNAGWITPCFALPLPMPGMFWKSLKWLSDPDSPLYIQPRPSLLLARWLWRFLRSMNARHLQASVAALTEISDFSLEAYARLERETPGGIGFDRQGLLMVGESEAGVRAAEEELRLVAAHGIEGRVLDAAQARQLEPALRGKIEGAVYFPGEAHAEPLAVVQALARSAQERGARILPRTEVYDFVIEGGRIRRLQTTRGVLKADRYVLATGSWSVSMGRRLGINIPVLGGKGYAITVPRIDPMPTHPIMIVERKIAITPRKDGLRLAGTLELVDRDESITPRRVAAILRGSQQMLAVPAEPAVQEVWRGLRPCTPDGVPVIGFPRSLSNCLVATGHQMLGLQSAPGSGRLAADLVLGATPTFDPHPFRATRF